jgi:uncharacterized protein (TIGR02246 family)
MLRSYGIFAVLFLAGWTSPSLGAASASAPPDSVSVRRELDLVNVNVVKAWISGDADLFASCFSEDGAMLRPGGRVLASRDSIRARMQATFSQYRATKGTIATLDLHLIGDRAYELGRWVIAAGPVGKPSEAEPDSGYYVQIWKPEGGRWKIWRNMGAGQ